MDPTLVDKIIAGDSAAEISDYIKDALFGKASDKIDALNPEVATQVFNAPLGQDEVDVEIPETGEPEE